MTNTLEEVEQFYLKHRPEADHDILMEAIAKHAEYNTITVLHDKNGISGLVRFDVIGDCAHITDLVIREGLENEGLIKLLAIESWHKFPFLRFFRFERARKYPERKPRAYRLSKLMRGI